MGVGEVYRHQGRANFAHQIAEADRLMAEHCRQVNGGRAVIVSHQTRNIGFGGIGQSQSQTMIVGSAAASPGLVTGTATGLTTGVDTASVMTNQNQEILFRCAR